MRRIDKLQERARRSVAAEKAVLIGLENDGWEERMEELQELAISAGAEVIGRITQKREEADPLYYIGRGKAEEIAGYLKQVGADLVIVDGDLSLLQHRNLERAFDIKVVDRTELILDIFAQRAHSKEGKLQIELAQLTYLLPRLTGRGVFLSRLGGGIGTRGPGETKLEVDRRRIRDRIALLKKELEEIRKQRARRRELRKSEDIPVVALVGYTNAGKSTLLNAITRASVYVDDRFFATLDPTTRRLRLKRGGVVLFTDTVGFIRDLPPNLVTAFRATLEEIREADILLHVVDGSHPHLLEQITTVNRILREEVKVEGKPMIYAINKIDKVDVRQLMQVLPSSLPNVVLVSALYGRGISRLLGKIAEVIERELTTVEVEIPYDRGDLLSLIYEKGRILEERFFPEGIFLKAMVPLHLKEKIVPKEGNKKLRGP